MILFLEYPKCSTCKKARNWLDSNGISYTSRHIVDSNPSFEELQEWFNRSNVSVRRFFNTSGMLYREQNIKAQLDAGISNDDALRLLASNGMLVKRPLIIADDFILIGFKEAEWTSKLMSNNE